MYKTLLLSTLLLLSVIAEEPNEQTLPNENQIKLQQQELSMKRTACLVLSRYHSNTQKETIESVITELPPELQQKYINKMYATAIEHCMPHMTMDDAQKFFIEDPNFSPVEMFHYFDTFDYTAVDPNKFTKNQENLVKFIKNFDEEMQVRREQREATKDEDEGESEFDMKFFGISRDDIPSSIKYAYIAIFAGIVVGAIWYLMSKLDTSKKEKSSRKKSKSASPKAASPPKSPKNAKKD